MNQKVTSVVAAESKTTGLPTTLKREAKTTVIVKDKETIVIHMGGVATDLEGRTSVTGPWAAGEVACTGVHGANRLASNSLLEALVFGARVALSVVDALSQLRRPASALALPQVSDAAGEPGPAEGEAESAVRRLMWEKVGLVRTGRQLREALSGLELLERALPPGVEATRRLLTVARLVAVAALARPESRGAHFRADHPVTQPAWRRRIVLTPAAGTIRVSTEPVPQIAAASAEASA